MQTNLRIALAASGGLFTGAAIMQVTHAQQVKAPPAYVIAEVEKDPTKAQDSAAARRYAEAAPKSLIPFGGQYVVRGGAVQALEGEAPKGYLVMIAFDSVEKARGWYDSPAYEAVKPIRQSSMKSRILLVEGVRPQPERSGNL